MDRPRRAVLAGACISGEMSADAFEVSMAELHGLCEACGIEAAGELTQNLPGEDKAYYIGSGKVGELKNQVYLLEADLVIFNNTLSPSQLANLAHDLEVEVIDKTNLILNIFAMRARTAEARMQVEYAKLQYMLPRLVGLRQNLSRQGGAGGSMSNKGAGEKQIELDRRHIQKEMAELRRALREVEQNRSTQRKKRAHSGLPLVALVGYTNAGKSTLMNRLIDLGTEDRTGIDALAAGTSDGRHVLVQDMLFATLDTTVRRISPGDHRDFLLSDTVGFINDLPHKLVEAFRSTLEEALYADLILEVIDCSDPHYRMHMDVTARTLKELGAGHIPVLYLMNKADRVYDRAALPIVRGDKLYISGAEGIGMAELLEAIDRKLFADYFTCELRIPYRDSGVENVLRERAQVLETKYEDDGIHIRAALNQELLQRYKDYVLM